MRTAFLLFLVGSSYLNAQCSENDMMCISQTLSPGSPGSQAGAGVVQGIQTGIDGYSQVGNLIDQAAIQRAGRYAPSAPSSGFSPEQIRQYHEDYQKNLAREQQSFKAKVTESLGLPEDVKQSFQKNREAQRAALEVLGKIKIPTPQSPKNSAQKPEKSEKEPSHRLLRETIFLTHRLSAEGKAIRKIINQALALNSQTQADFLISSALKADQLSMERAGQRWLNRANQAYAYWTDQPEKTSHEREILNQRARVVFDLPETKAETFERYEIIRAANLLSFESGLDQHDDLRLQASLALKQALIYAEEGETELVVQMTENVHAIKDFLKGFASGVKQNIYDTATGLWHTVTHPVDSAEAIANALINYRSTYDAISNHVHQVIEEYPGYSHEQKGALFGKIASEVAMILSPAGAFKNLNSHLKLQKGAAHLTETIAASHASNIANVRRLAEQLEHEVAKSAFTPSGTLTQETIANTKRCLFLPEELRNPKIPSGFGKFVTEPFRSPSGEFTVHYYKHMKTNEVYYDLDYKAVFNAYSGQRKP